MANGRFWNGVNCLAYVYADFFKIRTTRLFPNGALDTWLDMTNSPKSNFEKELSFTIAVCEQAGAILKEIREEQSLSISAKADFDFVTSADLAVDEHIVSRIKKTFPGQRIVSEEGTSDRVPSRGRCWVIDPLDGTMNYMHGHDHVAVSVALYSDKRPVVGVVHAPFHGQTFWASKRQGAFLDGRRLKVKTSVPDERALIAVGFPHDRAQIDSIVNRLKPLLRSFGDVRRLAAPALDICWVADGRLDAFIDRIKIWDVAAAGLIASEAGAKVCCLDEAGTEKVRFDGQDYLIANERLAKRILDLLDLEGVNERLGNRA